MLANLDAVVAVDANGVVPHNLAVSHGQGVSWAWLDARLAGDALHLGLGVVAVGAANVAALQEDGGSASWAIYQREGNDLVDRSNTPSWMCCSQIGCWDACGCGTRRFAACCSQSCFCCSTGHDYAALLASRSYEPCGRQGG